MIDKDKVMPLITECGDRIEDTPSGWAKAQRDADWERVKGLVEACRLIVAVQGYMMLQHIHDNLSAQEILEKHGAASIQLLAKRAGDKAKKALAQLGIEEKP